MLKWKEQATAHATLQKHLRVPHVRAGFEQSVEVKSWTLLKGSYFPTLLSSLSELRAQVQQLQTQAREFAVLLQMLIDSQMLIRRVMPRSSSDSSISEMSAQVPVLNLNAISLSHHSFSCVAHAQVFLNRYPRCQMSSPDLSCHCSYSRLRPSYPTALYQLRFSVILSLLSICPWMQ